MIHEDQRAGRPAWPPPVSPISFEHGFRIRSNRGRDESSAGRTRRGDVCRSGNPQAGRLCGHICGQHAWHRHPCLRRCGYAPDLDSGKTKSSGSWHARFPKDAAECSEVPAERSFWVFVDLVANIRLTSSRRGGGCATTSGETTRHTSLATRSGTDAHEKASSMESRPAVSNNGVIAGTFLASSPTEPQRASTAIRKSGWAAW